MVAQSDLDKMRFMATHSIPDGMTFGEWALELCREVIELTAEVKSLREIINAREEADAKVP